MQACNVPCGEPTAEIRCKGLPLLCAEETLLPQVGNLGADGADHVADIPQFQLLQTLNFCL